LKNIYEDKFIIPEKLGRILVQAFHGEVDEYYYAGFSLL